MLFNMKPYERHEQWIKNLIVQWYLRNGKEYKPLTNEFKK